MKQYKAYMLATTNDTTALWAAPLPLAGPKMYATLGPHWAANHALALRIRLDTHSLSSFTFYGHKIREKSQLIRQMREDREKLEGRRRRAAERAERLKEEEEARAWDEKKALDV